MESLLEWRARLREDYVLPLLWERSDTTRDVLRGLASVSEPPIRQDYRKRLGALEDLRSRLADAADDEQRQCETFATVSEEREFGSCTSRVLRQLLEQRGERYARESDLVAMANMAVDDDKLPAYLSLERPELIEQMRSDSVPTPSSHLDETGRLGKDDPDYEDLSTPALRHFGGLFRILTLEYRIRERRRESDETFGLVQRERTRAPDLLFLVDDGARPVAGTYRVPEPWGIRNDQLRLRQAYDAWKDQTGATPGDVATTVVDDEWGTEFENRSYFVALVGIPGSEAPDEAAGLLGVGYELGRFRDATGVRLRGIRADRKCVLAQVEHSTAETCGSSPTSRTHLRLVQADSGWRIADPERLPSLERKLVPEDVRLVKRPFDGEVDTAKPGPLARRATRVALSLGRADSIYRPMMSVHGERRRELSKWTPPDVSPRPTRGRRRRAGPIDELDARIDSTVVDRTDGTATVRVSVRESTDAARTRGRRRTLPAFEWDLHRSDGDWHLVERRRPSSSK